MKIYKTTDKLISSVKWNGNNLKEVKDFLNGAKAIVNDAEMLVVTEKVADGATEKGLKTSIELGTTMIKVGLTDKPFVIESALFNLLFEKTETSNIKDEEGNTKKVESVSFDEPAKKTTKK